MSARFLYKTSWIVEYNEYLVSTLNIDGIVFQYPCVSICVQVK